MIKCSYNDYIYPSQSNIVAFLASKMIMQYTTSLEANKEENATLTLANRYLRMQRHILLYI